MIRLFDGAIEATSFLVSGAETDDMFSLIVNLGERLISVDVFTQAGEEPVDLVAAVNAVVDN